MKFTLLLATIDRTVEVENFLCSLERQNYRDFNLIVIDQNEDDRIDIILNRVSPKYEYFLIKSERGLSRARNNGIYYARINNIIGDVVCFPDDDCWYPPDTLFQVFRRFHDGPDMDIISGKYTDDHGAEERNWPKARLIINRYNAWRCAISFTIFLRSYALSKEYNFDEVLGVGSGTVFGSGEETDFILKRLAAGFHAVYDPSICVRHPVKGTSYDSDSNSRALRYAYGYGRVLRVNDYGLGFVFFCFLKPLVRSGAAAFSLNYDKAAHYFGIFKGRVTGWWIGRG